MDSQRSGSDRLRSGADAKPDAEPDAQSDSCTDAVANAVTYGGTDSNAHACTNTTVSAGAAPWRRLWYVHKVWSGSLQ